MKRIIIALAALTIGGCATASHYKSWEGYSPDDIVVAWGPPTGVSYLSDGRSQATFNKRVFDWNCDPRIIYKGFRILRVIPPTHEICMTPRAAMSFPSP